MRYHIEARTTGADIIGTIDTDEEETWQHALARLWKKAYGTRETVQLARHFAGGTTWHVQMGHSLGGRADAPATLEPTIVVRVEPVE